MQAYVVNLARSGDRRAHMIAQLVKTRLDYEITAAVDGRTLDLTDTRLFDPTVDSSYTAGVFGCVLSHLAIYQKVLDAGLTVALVLEDDVVLPADLDSLLEAVVRQMEGAEVVLLNFSSNEACWITKAGSVPLPRSRRLVQIVDRDSPWSGAGYLITREACERMVKLVLPVRARADMWAHFYHEGALDRVRCVVPMPITTSVTLRSTKDNYRPGSVQARVLRVAASAKISPLYHALALRKRWHLRHYARSGRTKFVGPLPGGEPPPLLMRNP